MAGVIQASDTKKFDHDDFQINLLTVTTDFARSAPGLQWFHAKELSDHALFIISGGTSKLEDIPEYWRCSRALLDAAFHRITLPTVDEERFYSDLMGLYHSLFGLELHITIHDGEKEYVIYPEHPLPENTRKDNLDKNAFMYVDKKKWQYRSLYCKHLNDPCNTVFTIDEMSRKCCEENHIEIQNFSRHVEIEQKNDQIMADSVANHQDEQLYRPMENTTNDPNAAEMESGQTNVSCQDQLEHTSKTFLELYDDAKQILMTFGTSFTNERIRVRSHAFDLTNLESKSQNDRNNLLINHLEIICSIINSQTHATISQQNEIMDTSNDTLQENPDGQNRNGHGSIAEFEPLITHPEEELSVDAPEISVKPAEYSRARNLKDLVPKPKDGKRAIGLLQGTGQQRTRVQVKLPKNLPENGRLACQVHTVDREPHPQKLIVPEGTTAISDMVSDENNLDCLDLSQVDSTIVFDQEKKIVNFEITAKDRENGTKEIPVYLLTLYQNSRLTKALIEAGEWWNCRLAFWFYEESADHYKTLSRKTWSEIIKQNENDRTTKKIR